MPITSRRLLVPGLLLGLFTASALTAPPAHAAGWNGVCEAGEFCVYQHANNSGPIMDWPGSVDDRHYDNETWPVTQGPVDDATSSIWNRTSCPVSIWQHPHFTGPGIVVKAGERRNAGGTTLGDNTASSHNVCP
jgi:Peptidase inhibitor family I36